MSKRAGFHHHLVKPVDPGYLINLLGRRQHRAERIRLEGGRLKTSAGIWSAQQLRESSRGTRREQTHVRQHMRDDKTV
jgi:hypothetical protein